MNSSLLTPSSSSSSQIQTQSFDHDDFLDHIFSAAPWPSVVDDAPPHHHPTTTSEGGVSAFHHHSHDDSAVHLASRLSQQQIMMMPLPLGNDGQNDVVDGSVQALYNGFAAAGSLHAAAGGHSPPNQSLPFHLPQGSGGGLMNNQGQGQGQGQAAQPQASGSTATGTGGAPPQTKPKVRARRGQATDPHSIAERLRRERIAERMKALQELVPNANKTDKASMLDEIIDYVKFLQLQVKVLSMSRLGGAASVSSHMSEGAGGDRGTAGGPHVNSTNGNQTAPSNSNNNNNNGDNTLTMTEHQVAKLMEEDMGSAMQYLQGKGLCLMPISLATAISTATCHSRNPLIAGGNAGADGGPSSPNVSVMTVQSTNTAPICNGVTDGPSSAVKDSTSVSKP